VLIIGVIDLLGGRAVRARAGRREHYAPVEAAGGLALNGDPVALARMYIDRLGIEQLYAADLDAILGRQAQRKEIGAITALGKPVWIDAGVRSTGEAREALDLGAARVVVGLETLPSFAVLAEVADSAGRARVAFSLDLREGAPIFASVTVMPADRGSSQDDGGADAGAADAVAARAAACGVGAIIVIDLARVGTGRGLDLALIERVRRAAPGVTLIAGGGVQDLADLEGLARAGCDGALVAWALCDGRLAAADVEAAHRFERGGGEIAR
jgi:phosphoribosylformimino-5-aminoimidazole carboxamide ribotide isomerase